MNTLTLLTAAAAMSGIHYIKTPALNGSFGGSSPRAWLKSKPGNQRQRRKQARRRNPHGF